MTWTCPTHTYRDLNTGHSCPTKERIAVKPLAMASRLHKVQGAKGANTLCKNSFDLMHLIILDGFSTGPKLLVLSMPKKNRRVKIHHPRCPISKDRCRHLVDGGIGPQALCQDFSSAIMDLEALGIQPPWGTTDWRSGVLKDEGWAKSGKWLMFGN